MNVEVFKRTSDDWYPSFSCEEIGQLVCVSFSLLDHTEMCDRPEKYVVSTCGNDDFSFSRFFESEQHAWTVFLQIIGQEDVSHEFVKSLGLEFSH